MKPVRSSTGAVRLEEVGQRPDADGADPDQVDADGHGARPAHRRCLRARAAGQGSDAPTPTALGMNLPGQVNTGRRVATGAAPKRRSAAFRPQRSPARCSRVVVQAPGSPGRARRPLLQRIDALEEGCAVSAPPARRRAAARRGAAASAPARPRSASREVARAVAEQQFLQPRIVEAGRLAASACGRQRAQPLQRAPVGVADEAAVQVLVDVDRRRRCRAAGTPRATCRPAPACRAATSAWRSACATSMPQRCAIAGAQRLQVADDHRRLVDVDGLDRQPRHALGQLVAAA